MKSHLKWLCNITGIALASGVLTSCYSPTGSFQPGTVYREWSGRMSELGIFPVFPPREDVLVGDVYALPMHPYDNRVVEQVGGLGKVGIHIGYYNWVDRTNRGDLLKTLKEYYATRPTFPDTTNDFTYGTNGSLSLVRVPRLPGNCPSNDCQTGVFDPPNSIVRLRQVAFPEFSVATINSGSLAAVIPIEAIIANLGFNYEKIDRISVKVPQAESYGLPTDLLLEKLFQPANKLMILTNGGIYLRADAPNTVINGAGAQLARQMFNGVMGQMLTQLKDRLSDKALSEIKRSAIADKDCIYLTVVSEVFFARAIDITISSTKGFSAGASARPLSASELASLKQMVTGTNQPSTGSQSTNQPPPATAGLPASGTNDLAWMTGKLQELNLNQGISSVGGTVQIMGVSDRAIGVRRTFERPITVGVRGALLKLDVRPVTLSDQPGFWFKVVPEELGSVLSMAQ